MFDVAVIGGGLAGCHAAITLAQRKHRVVLLEGGAYPRPKVCGEFLSPESMALFASTDFMPKLRQLKPVSISTLRITAPNGNQWRSTFSTPALGISRFALDKALADYAAELGVEVCEGTHVTQIEGDLREGFTISASTQQGNRTFHAKSVIAAHGRRSNVDRLLNRTPSKPAQAYLGLKQHFQGDELPNHIDLHVFQGGYCGMSQVEDGTTNVCLLVRQDVFNAVKNHSSNRIAHFIDWMSEQNRHIGRWLSRATPVYPDWLSIAQVSLKTKTPVKAIFYWRVMQLA